MLRLRLIPTLISASLIAASTCMGQAVLSPPFGLQWGDSPEKLVSWAAKHNLNTTINIPGKQDGLRIVEISPEKGFLPDTQASAIEGRFISGKLYELSVHYFDPEVSADTIAARFDKLKKQLTIEHGKLLTNQQERSMKDQFVTRTQSFHREPVKGLFLLLAYTEVEDLKRSSKLARFSLVYRNDNFRKSLQAELENKK